MQEWLKVDEETLKNKVREAYFSKFSIVGSKIDFIITQKHKDLGEINLFWAEAKQGISDIKKSFIQLILTIGKHKFHAEQTPALIGAFDAEKIAFLSFSKIQEVFYKNDIDWSVTPSDHTSEQFLKLLKELDEILNEALIFYYEKNDEELKNFIKENLTNENISKFKIDKNNFVSIYHKWSKSVKESISIDWDLAKKNGIIDADFYLADLLSNENQTIVEKLFAILNKDHYEFNAKKTDLGSIATEKTGFKDNQKAHKDFWAIYERPPLEEFWDYMIERRDLLVDQDIRERKGAFFTPRIWVDKACEYLSKTFGKDYEEKYYIWDCAGGTGNLLANFTNAKNVFCSTIDKADVDVIHERIKNGANLFENHVFQFDFLNDEFFDKVDDKGNVIYKSKLPSNLQEILKDENKRKKLIIFINPPYAEASTYGEKGKNGVANTTNIFNKYQKIVRAEALNELFAQFFIRISYEIKDCYLAQFSTLKFLLSSNFHNFRDKFNYKFLNGFIVPSDTFDNVDSDFPIGFFIWDLSKYQNRKIIQCSIFNKDGLYFGCKKIHILDKNTKTISDWRKEFFDNQNPMLAQIILVGPSMQSNRNTFVTLKAKQSYIDKKMVANITKSNLFGMSIYLTIRYIVKNTWLNNRDQFLYPNKAYQNDKEFQNDCLAFMLFYGQNYISAKEGVNHFIPFSEKELGITQEAFKSDFMYKFINGKIKNDDVLFDDTLGKVEFSNEAKELLKAGKELFKYYHTHKEKAGYLVNASLYDIKEFFQGRDEKGKMNMPSKAKDEHYKILLNDLNLALDVLAKKIEPKIYEYGFLRE